MNSEDSEDAKGLTDRQRVTAIKVITKFLCWKMLGVIVAGVRLD
jgi:hypothetical protein